MKKRLTCVVDAVRAPILSEPRSDADVVCKVRYLTELEIIRELPREGYFQVCSAIGAEGYCEKSLVKIR